MNFFLSWQYFPFSLFWTGTSFITPQSHIMCFVSLLLWTQMLHRHTTVSQLHTDWSQRRQMQRQSVHTTRKIGNCDHAQGFWIFFMADVHTAECVHTRVRKCTLQELFLQYLHFNMYPVIFNSVFHWHNCSKPQVQDWLPVCWVNFPVQCQS